MPKPLRLPAKVLHKSLDELQGHKPPASGRCGRFAPSPTGPLHIGSLATALASWLDAKAEGYRWLVRMEDLDPPRQAPGSAEFILLQLTAHGLTWDKDPHPAARANGILYQSDRGCAYEKALSQLMKDHLVYGCRCSRKKLLEAAQKGLARRSDNEELIYPGFCRGLLINDSSHPLAAQGRLAWRFRNPENDDDFVLRRADGFWAYHLAVVVDDADQGITDIIRGDDLADSAPRHRALGKALGKASIERLIHVPVVRNMAAEKLSKQTHAPALEIQSSQQICSQLGLAWTHLQAHMPTAWIQKTAPVFNQLMREKSRLG